MGHSKTHRRNTLRSLWTRRKRRQRTEAHNQGFTHRFETLEARMMLAADLSTSFDDQVALLTNDLPQADWHEIAEGEGAAEAESSLSGSLTEFAEGLRDAGVIFYGAFWCPACQSQKAQFGDAQALLPFVEVTAGDPADNNGELILNAVGEGTDPANRTGETINNFPTWEFPQGDGSFQRITGELSLQQLSQESGVPLPTNNDDTLPSNFVTIDTNAPTADGDFSFTIELLPGSSPQTVENFLAYLNGDNGGPTFDNTIIHRNVSGFVVQGGGFLGDSTPLDTSTTVLTENPTRTDSSGNEVFVQNEFGFHVKTTGSSASTTAGSNVIQLESTADLSQVQVTDLFHLFDNPISSQVFNFDPDSARVFEILAVDDANNTITVQERAAQGVTISDSANGISWRVAPAVNVQGTISMAKVGSARDTITGQNPEGRGPNSATNQFFVSLNDNSLNLDGQNGGFTVFAKVVDNDLSEFVNLASDLMAADASFSVARDSGTAPQTFQDFAFFRDDNNDPIAVVLETFNATGTLSGVAFEDLNRNGLQEQDEPGLAGRVIYSDVDGTPGLSAGDITATTSSDGSYELVLTAGQHNIRQDGFGSFFATSPLENMIDVEMGRTQTLDLGSLAVPNLAGVDLVDASDSGDPTDNLTNFNNSTSQLAPSFTVNGITPGSRIRLRIDGAEVTSEIVYAESFTFTLDGMTALSEGSHIVSVNQEIEGVSGNSVQLGFQIDSVAPAFQTNAPTFINIDELFTYAPQVSETSTFELRDANTNAEVDPALGIGFNPANGTFTWQPDQSMAGSHQFNLIATDAAGNRTIQTLNLEVSEPDLVDLLVSFVDEDGNAISEVNVGDRFFTVLTLDDLRPDGTGPFSGYADVVFDRALAEAISIINSPDFTLAPNPNFHINETIVDVLIDQGLNDIGASGGLTPPGGAPIELLRIEMVASASGIFDVSTDPAEGSGREFSLHGSNASLTDGEVGFGSATLIINGSIVVQNPTFGPDEDTSRTITLDELAGLRDGATGNLAIREFSQPANGMVQFAQVNGSEDRTRLLFTPNQDFVGGDQFSYTIESGTEVARGTVTLAVQPVNDPPVANPDSPSNPDNGDLFVVFENTTSILPVRANDTDVDDLLNDLTVEVVSFDTQFGTLTRAPNDLGFEYQPAPNFQGQFSFTYRTLDDDGAASEPTTVNVEVVPLIPPPTATDDTFPLTGEILEDSTNNTLNVLDNDSPAQDGALAIIAVSTPASGSMVTFNQTRDALVYTPAPNFFGTDTFTYRLAEEGGGQATATVTVTVTGVNDNPNAVDDTFRFVTNGGAEVLNVTANDLMTSFPEDETLTIVDVSDVTVVSGTANPSDFTAVAEAGGIRFDAPAEFEGEVTFTYTIDDRAGSGLQNTATVTVIASKGLDFAGRLLASSDFLYADESAVISGISWSAFAVDANGQPTGDPVQTVVPGPDGTFQFSALPPGEYQFSAGQIPFLTSGDMSVSLTDTSSTDNQLGGFQRRLDTLTAFDGIIMPTPSVLSIALTRGAAQHDWLESDTGWTGMTSFSATLTPDNQAIDLDVTDGSGRAVGRIPLTDSRVVVVSTEGDSILVRLHGTRTNFNDILGPVAAGEGEANPAVTQIAAAAVPVTPPAPVVSVSAPQEETSTLEGEGEQVMSLESISTTAIATPPVTPLVETNTEIVTAAQEVSAPTPPVSISLSAPLALGEPLDNPLLLISDSLGSGSSASSSDEEAATTSEHVRALDAVFATPALLEEEAPEDSLVEEDEEKQVAAADEVFTDEEMVEEVF